MGGVLGGVVLVTRIIERPRDERPIKKRKGKEMAQRQGVESRKDHIAWPFGMVEIRGVEPMTFSMPLR